MKKRYVITRNQAPSVGANGISNARLTDQEVEELRKQGAQVDLRKDLEVVPNRAMLRAQGYGKKPARRRRTRKSNVFTTMEQHFRPNGLTRGKKQVYRFPIPQGMFSKQDRA
jgi:hypothetical protein